MLSRLNPTHAKDARIVFLVLRCDDALSFFSMGSFVFVKSSGWVTA